MKTTIAIVERCEKNKELDRERLDQSYVNDEFKHENGNCCVLIPLAIVVMQSNAMKLLQAS